MGKDKTPPRVAMVLASLAAAAPAQAHTAGNPGVLAAWLHPLSGADHLVAMVAVGAWSALLGRRAILAVRLRAGCWLLQACGWFAAIFGVWLLAAPAVG